MTRRLPIPLLLHGVLFAAVLLVLALRPPAEGTLLLVPIAAAPGMLASAALAADARLVGRGPGRSLVVRGARDRIKARLRLGDALLLAAPSPLCGDAIGVRA
ncbi:MULTISPECIES: hypothetical protein [unclassified Sphingomonas]|uniref:hypothetical protein n=1 Tax=unclassified Sphingomonas TaxID=196159 RepID=UPI001615C6B0|nr:MULTISPECIES: hypothetical protein [unclassified Sphingomonas]MBB3347985.1 hypothetical protein [Sphingomonas sp. BK069]MBB3473935.1 hypothetical protein [Sphingomonas sp. BK345]